MQGVLFKNILLAGLLGSQYLLEILQSSLSVKYNENGVKSGWFQKLLGWRAPFFSERKEGYKVSCVKTLIFC